MTEKVLAVLLVMAQPAPVQAIVDPVTAVNQYLMLALMIVALFFLIKYRDRVLFLITGDTQVHVDLNSSLWVVFCTCCRQCDGGWTKYITYYCCCCCSAIRGRNLKRILGQVLGVVPIPVHISNIMVGDLPIFVATDVFLSIEVGTNPPQITSIAEDAQPKVVQFPDELLVRIRRSPAEGHVRFVVKALHLFGSTELCDCYINPIFLVQWSKWPQGPKRFRMDPIDRQRSDSVFPPWILMELSPQQEYGGPGGFNVRLTEFSTGTQRTVNQPGEFKETYPLLNTYGIAAEEPSEATFGRVNDMRMCRGALLTQSCFCFCMILIVFYTARIYCFACYREYQIIHVLDSHSLEFPVTEEARDHFSQRCGLAGNIVIDLLFGISSSSVSTSVQLAGGIVNNSAVGSDVVAQTQQASDGVTAVTLDTLGKATARNVSLAQELCSVEDEAVRATCHALPFGAAVPCLHWDLFGQISGVLPCGAFTCDENAQLEKLDLEVLLVLAGIMVLMCAVKCVFDKIIGNMEANLHPSLNQRRANPAASSSPAE